ncbi:phosphate regulon sensor histidine kinase PhoR, partial [Rhizobium ruizarguesonis]
MALIRRERPVLLAAILSALAALASGMNKWVVLGLLLVMILTSL